MYIIVCLQLSVSQLCRGSLTWPARSPDLSAADFFLWGHLKEREFYRQFKNTEELKASFRGISQEMLQ
jgi:hypothetical protein